MGGAGEWGMQGTAATLRPEELGEADKFTGTQKPLLFVPGAGKGLIRARLSQVQSYLKPPISSSSIPVELWEDSICTFPV